MKKHWQTPTLEMLDVKRTMWIEWPCNKWPWSEAPFCGNEGGGNPGDGDGGGGLDS